ncbi:MAG: DUF4339 domain-containing protein [Thermoguttaceae bacterium]|nr:DUF4339 domain-containing protein [Thermoguttaceae bacterium]
MQFYYFIDGERKGPVGTSQLKMLAALGKIQKESEVELEDGRRIQARKIKGLTFKGETPEENADGGDIHGVAEPVAPPPVAPPVPPTIDDMAAELLGAAPVPPVDLPIPVPSASQPVSRVEKPAQRKKFSSSGVLFALSVGFLAAALLSALVGGALLLKTQSNPKNAPAAERLDELEKKRAEDALILLGAKDLLKTESAWVAFKTKSDWQKAALEDARLRPSASVEAYMNALERLDFDRHEFVGGDAFNLEVNASLFTGLATLGVGTDVRDVRSEVRSASAVIAAGAGFVCAALFASTSALLFGLGLLTRRLQAA